MGCELMSPKLHPQTQLIIRPDPDQPWSIHLKLKVLKIYNELFLDGNYKEQI